MSPQNDSAVSQYNKAVIVGVGSALTLLAIIVVALRFFARRRCRVQYDWDDWSIFLALASGLANAIVFILPFRLMTTHL